MLLPFRVWLLSVYRTPREWTTNKIMMNQEGWFDDELVTGMKWAGVTSCIGISWMKHGCIRSRTRKKRERNGYKPCAPGQIQFQCWIINMHERLSTMNPPERAHVFTWIVGIPKRKVGYRWPLVFVLFENHASTNLLLRSRSICQSYTGNRFMGNSFFWKLTI